MSAEIHPSFSPIVKSRAFAAGMFKGIAALAFLMSLVVIAVLYFQGIFRHPHTWVIIPFELIGCGIVCGFLILKGNSYRQSTTAWLQRATAVYYQKSRMVPMLISTNMISSNEGFPTYLASLQPTEPNTAVRALTSVPLLYASHPRPEPFPQLADAPVNVYMDEDPQGPIVIEVGDTLWCSEQRYVRPADHMASATLPSMPGQGAALRSDIHPAFQPSLKQKMKSFIPWFLVGIFVLLVFAGQIWAPILTRPHTTGQQTSVMSFVTLGLFTIFFLGIFWGPLLYMIISTINWYKRATAIRQTQPGTPVMLSVRKESLGNRGGYYAFVQPIVNGAPTTGTTVIGLMEIPQSDALAETQAMMYGDPSGKSGPIVLEAGTRLYCSQKGGLG